MHYQKYHLDLVNIISEHPGHKNLPLNSDDAEKYFNILTLEKQQPHANHNKS